MSSPGAPVWVGSLGGPLVVVPLDALREWGGQPPDGDPPSGDYGRACAAALDAYAAVVEVGSAAAIVLGDEPATTCWLPEHSAFLRWVGADSLTDVLRGADVVLADPDAEWEDAGVWETSGPAVLMDSAQAGSELAELGTVEHEDAGVVEVRSAVVPIDAGRWRVRACGAELDELMLVLVHLTPA